MTIHKQINSHSFDSGAIKKLILIWTSVLALTVAYAQHNFGLKANIGLSYLYTRFEPNPTQNETNKFYPMPSGQGGLFYNFRFKDKFLIGTDVLIIPIYGHEYLKLPLVDINGNSIGVSEDHIYRHIYYLGIPVYFGYSFKKVNINLGFQTNFAFASGGETKGNATYNGHYSTWDNKTKKLGINGYDYGARVGLLYKLSDKLSIETNYYYGLTNLIKDSSIKPYWTWKVQQWTVGLRYNLFVRGG